MATSLCSLAHPSTDLSRADALAQLEEIQPSFVRTRAVDPEAFLLGVKQVATSLPACSFLWEPRWMGSGLHHRQILQTGGGGAAELLTPHQPAGL